MPRRKTVRRTAIRRTSARTGRSERSLASVSRFGESYTSLVLGIIAVIIISVVFLSFNRHKGTEKSSEQEKTSISATSTVNPEIKKQATGDTYTVAPGDDLWKIAEKVYHDGYAWTQIAKANNITDPNMLYAGTVLKTPKLERTETSSVITVAPTRGPAENPQQNQTQQTDKITAQQYTVVRGDYLWEIAVRKYGDGYRWVDIARANNLQNPDLIHSGNVLSLP